MKNKNKLMAYLLTASMMLSGMGMPIANAEETLTDNASWTEQLNRGLTAVKTDSGVYLSWRLYENEDNRFGNADTNVSFDIYRNGEKIATESNSTNYIDESGTADSKYMVVLSGETPDDYITKVKSIEGSKVTVQSYDNNVKLYAAKYNGDALEKVALFDVDNFGENTFDAGFDVDKAFVWDGMSPAENILIGETSVNVNGYLSIPLQKPEAVTLADGNTYSYGANDASCGDVDGDGEYEIILKWDCNGQDNSNSGYTGNVLLDAYELDGTFLWRIDLGQNIRAGAHYTQFLVYDFDGDGGAEIACKTAPGSKDSAGEFVTKASHVASIAAVEDSVNNENFVNDGGRILDGDEYYTVFDGDGTAIDTIKYTFPRGDVASWGNNENYGNRCDRFLGAVAYLDGVTPSIISVRGYYGKTTVVAMTLKNGKLGVKKTFTTDTAGTKYEGQGNHNITVADVDADGKDEILTGSLCLDDDLSLLWCSGRGHGDALHIGDYDPTHEGYEYFSVHESGEYEITSSTTSSQGKTADYGMTVYDAATGEEIIHVGRGSDTGRGCMANVGSGGFYQISGAGEYQSNGGTNFTASASGAGTNFRVFWDGDLYDELLDGTSVTSWNGSSFENVFNASNYDCTKVNGTKSNPSLQADLFGDWREELVYPTNDSSELRVFTTTTKTDYKMKTLMHDRVYREGVAAEQTAYNQPPHIGFYVSEDIFYGKLTDIEINTDNVKKTYYVGDKLDTTGLVVTGKYNDNDDRELSNYSVSGYDAAKSGVQTLTVSYLGISKTYDINVIGEDKIEVSCTDAEYLIGEEFAKSNVEVKLVYDDSTSKIVDKFKVTEPDMLCAGKQTLTVTYSGIEGEYTAPLSIEYVTNAVIENGVITGYNGTEESIVIPTSTVDSEGNVTLVTAIADGAFVDSSVNKVYIYSEDIVLDGDNIFADGTTIGCIEGSTADQYAQDKGFEKEEIAIGDEVTFDEDFYTSYVNANMLMQNSSAEGTLADEFVTYKTAKADRGPWMIDNAYGFAIKNDIGNNYLYVNAGIRDFRNDFSQVYITLNEQIDTSANQTVAFDVMFPSNAGAAYIELQNDAGTVIDTVSVAALGLTNDVWYRYELVYNGSYTAKLYGEDGGLISKRELSVTAGEKIVSSIAFKQEFVWTGSFGSAQTGTVAINNMLFN